MKFKNEELYILKIHGNCHILNLNWKPCILYVMSCGETMTNKHGILLLVELFLLLCLVDYVKYLN